MVQAVVGWRRPDRATDRPTGISRRDSLKLFGLLPVVATGSTLLPSTQARAVPGLRAVDTHCHVFNASDLPVRGFVQRVVLSDEEDQVVLHPDQPTARAIGPWFAGILIDILSNGGAPSAAAELKHMDREPVTDFARSAVRSTEPRSQEFLREVLERTLVETNQGFPNSVTQSVDSAVLRGRVLLLEEMLHSTGLDGGSPTDLQNEDEPFDDLSRALLVGNDVFSRHIRWALDLTSQRRRIIDKIMLLYGGADRVGLFTPAMIDFSGWLNDEPESSVADQVILAERIQRLEYPSLIHWFAPFDPWRQIADEDRGARPTALEIVQNAIQDLGFIGVKLYPPMGFLPIGNDRPGLTFPRRALTDFTDFAARIDGALRSLYAWAEANDVPIMAHATNSNGAAPTYADRAAPINWRPVLAEFPALRLNLGHFGDFQEAVRDAELPMSWEYMIGKLIAAGNGHVYADMSYLHEVLADNVSAPRRAELVRFLSLFLERFDPQARRLMYGSDWIMLGQESEHNQYLSAIEQLMDITGLTQAQKSRFFRGNAIEYLGLAPGRKGRERLEHYYRRNLLDLDRLRWLDGAA